MHSMRAFQSTPPREGGDEAIRAAAAASDEHNELVHLRGNMADLAGMAQRAKNSDEETKAMRLDVLMDSCISIGRLMGFLRREE